jgi:hypothetical protein
MAEIEYGTSPTTESCGTILSMVCCWTTEEGDDCARNEGVQCECALNREAAIGGGQYSLDRQRKKGGIHTELVDTRGPRGHKMRRVKLGGG